MAWDDDEEDQDGATSAFMYGGGPQDDPGNANAYQGARETPTPAAPVTTPGLPPAQNARVSPVASSPDDDDLKPPTYNPAPLPAPPSGNLDEERQLEQQLSGYAKPTDRNAAGIRPTFGQQVRGRVAAALSGFGGNRNAVEIGRGVIDQNYDRAEQARQQGLSSTQQQLGALRTQDETEGQDWERQLQAHNAGTADFNTQDRAFNNSITARDRAAQEKQRLQGIAPGTAQPDDPKNPMGSWHATTIGGQAIKMAQPPDDWLKTPAGKQAEETSRRQGLVRDNHLTGDDAKFVMVNGKLREPNPTVTVRNEPEGKVEFDSYVSSLGHPPTTQDLLNWKHGGKGAGANSGLSKSLADRIDSQKNTALAKAREQFGKGDDPDYTLDDYLNDWQGAQDDYEQRIATATGQEPPHLTVRDHVDKKGNWVGAGAPGSAPAPRQSAAPAGPSGNAAPATQAAPNLPNGGGKPLTDRKIAQQFLQAAGGDKVKARQLASQQNWKF